MNEGCLVYVLRLLAFCFSFCGDGAADFGEGRCDVSRGIVEGGAGVADRDADELDASLISSEGAKEGLVLLGLLG